MKVDLSLEQYEGIREFYKILTLKENEKTGCGGQFWFFNFFDPLPVKKWMLDKSLPSLLKAIDTKEIKMLDLGCGSGDTLVSITAYLHFVGKKTVAAKGMEVNPFPYKAGVKALEELNKLNMLGGSSIMLHHGNIFPPDFNVLHEVKWGTLPYEAYAEIANKDVYQEMGLQLHDFNLIHMYQQTNYQAILDLLGERASPGALILAHHPLPEHRYKLPKNFETIHNSGYGLFKIREQNIK